MIVTFHIESINILLKILLYNSNIIIYDLIKEIYIFLNKYNKKNEYNF